MPCATVGAALSLALAASSAWANAPAPASVPTPATAATTAATTASAPPGARPGPLGSSWQFGAVLDVAQLSRPVALGIRDGGLGLGHSDLLARGTLGRHFSAEGIVSVATHEGHVESGIEKLFVQSRTLPAGLRMRAGRFASQVGYLNEQHPHADDFVERPPLYRAFLGHHYFDDGVRLNWTAPTPFYLQLGAEVFSGRKLLEHAHGPRAGVSVLNAKFGADIGLQHSWQGGLSWVTNRRVGHEVHHDEDHSDHSPMAEHGLTDHAHGHGALFSGRQLALADLAWKWAPNGNSREQQVRWVFEHARVTGLREAALAGRQHEASSLSLVWRFRPDWEAGVRADRLRAFKAHDGHADAVRLNEQSVMLAYKPSHRQALRLQWMTQRNGQGLEALARRTVALQYVVSFGAHGAHSF